MRALDGTISPKSLLESVVSVLIASARLAELGNWCKLDSSLEITLGDVCGEGVLERSQEYLLFPHGDDDLEEGRGVGDGDLVLCQFSM